MGNINLESNVVALVGEITSDFAFNHEVYGEKFYVFELAVSRMSNAVDYIPVMVSERLVNVEESLKGRLAYVSGRYRSFNLHEDEKHKLVLTVFANEIELDVDYEPTNRISLEGFVCKEPIYRKTPMGREIADVLVAVNRAYGKSDYIPCVFWGRNAKYAATFSVGTALRLNGRVQSREYQKQISETEFEPRVAYEVSVAYVEVI